MGALRRGRAVIAATVVVEARRRAVPAAVRRRRFLLTVANHAILIAVSLGFLLPILFMLATALMTDQQALSQRLVPSPVQW